MRNPIYFNSQNLVFYWKGIIEGLNGELSLETKSLLEVEKLALKKQTVYQKNILHYLLRSALASMFIGFGVIVTFKTGGFF